MTADLVDRLAQEIRSVDGWHSLGAGALAEALAPFVEREAASVSTAPSAGVGVDGVSLGLSLRELTQALAQHYRETSGDERHASAAIMAAETAGSLMRLIVANRAAALAGKEGA